jgi:hypothetical protein
MPCPKPTDRGLPDPFLPRPENRSTERAVLAFLLDAHPERRLRTPEAVAAINAGLEESDPGDSAECAIRELVRAELLRIEPQHGYLVPTPAAVYFDRLERD